MSVLLHTSLGLFLLSLGLFLLVFLYDGRMATPTLTIKIRKREKGVVSIIMVSLIRKLKVLQHTSFNSYSPKLVTGQGKLVNLIVLWKRNYLNWLRLIFWGWKYCCLKRFLSKREAGNWYVVNKKSVFSIDHFILNL